MKPNLAALRMPKNGVPRADSELPFCNTARSDTYNSADDVY